MACYETGLKFHTRNFILFVLMQPQNAHWRLGLAVGKKLGCAVKRNRVKRVLREFFRLNQHEIDKPLDIVAVPKYRLDVSRLSLSQASEELLPLLRKILRQGQSGQD